MRSWTALFTMPIVLSSKERPCAPGSRRLPARKSSIQQERLAAPADKPPSPTGEPDRTNQNPSPGPPPCGLTRGVHRHLPPPALRCALRALRSGGGSLLCTPWTTRLSVFILYCMKSVRVTPKPLSLQRIIPLTAKCRRQYSPPCQQGPLACRCAMPSETGVAKSSASRGGLDRPAVAISSARPPPNLEDRTK